MQAGRYRLEVLGEAARWAQVEPRHVAVAPDGADQVVEVVFRPPHAAATPELRMAFGVRAYAVDDRDRAAVVEGELLVTAVPDLTASIEPGGGRRTVGCGLPGPVRALRTRPGRAAGRGRGHAAGAALRRRPRRSPSRPGTARRCWCRCGPGRRSCSGAGPARVRRRPPRRDGQLRGRSTAVFEQRAVLPTAVAATLGVLVTALLVGAALVVSGARAPAPAAAAAAAGVAPRPPPGRERPTR